MTNQDLNDLKKNLTQYQKNDVVAISTIINALKKLTTPYIFVVQSELGNQGHHSGEKSTLIDLAETIDEIINDIE